MSQFIAIDLKSFYASVECVERGFDPLKTNLVVADESRTEKTICLAVSPSLKSYGISGRARLYEVVQRVKEVNRDRQKKIHYKPFKGDSYFDDEIKNNDYLALNYYVAAPRMSYYMKYSAKIYDIYLKYVSKDDIHVYSIDEVFIDATTYLNNYKMSAKDLALVIIKDILLQTGITATCGIGENLYLAKVAMDVVAKHMPADENGVRIAELSEIEYRRQLWSHRPLTDFWRIGKGIAKKLEDNGIYTQGDIARCSIKNEEKLYKLFGINAELIIDHAWGYEPTRIQDIKAYKPQSNSLSSGQVLKKPYSFDSAKLVIKEMADSLSLDLVEKKLITDQIVITVGYDVISLENYEGEIQKDFYGRSLPKQAHGSINLERYTSSSSIIKKAVIDLYENIVNPKLKVRRMYVVANHTILESTYDNSNEIEQLDLFSDYSKVDEYKKKKEEELRKERNMQEAIISIHNKYGKNSLIRGNDLQEDATLIERNSQIGGHKA